MPEILPTAAYASAAIGTANFPQYPVSPLDERHTLNVVDDEGTIPRYYFTPRFSTTSTYQPSADSPQSCRDFALPKAPAPLLEMMKPSPVPSPRYAYPSSTYPASYRASSADSDFDSLYDVTDDEAEQALSLITSHNLSVPARSAAPSLDGSLTSEEMDKLSCPSTPETHKRVSISSVDSWAPVQLDDQALATLRHLSRSRDSSRGSSPERQPSRGNDGSEGEMREVRPMLNLRIPSGINQNSSGNTPVSALSVPSPGGFFSSLQPTTRHTWSLPKRDESIPNTSTAEKFYSLPWAFQRMTPAQHAIMLAGSTLDGFDDGLPTSRPVMLGEAEEAVEVSEIHPAKTIFQYNENYHVELQKLSSANIERTGHWLEEQEELQAALRDMDIISSPQPLCNSIDKTIKKSVKFAEEPLQSPKEEEEPKKIVTYVQGFEFLRQRTRRMDVYIHRQTRAEAMHVHRRCNPRSHRDQLLGKFELTNPVRPAPPRPVSEFYVNDPTVLKERIARAQMERQALDQMLPICWVLQALRQLNGGKLLSKPSAKIVRRTSIPKILDVGGVPTNDWAWDVAYDYPYATVTTVYSAGHNLTCNVTGPSNHKHTTVPNLWTLPFPSGHFDVVSARTLHELLKTDKPLGRSMDEYDLCLKECFRCLKPGGILEFALLDADIIHAGRHAQALGVEFGFNLKTRGYDAAPTKSFLPRLRKAGFRDVQRMWMVLPMGKTAANWKETLPVLPSKAATERSISPEGEVIETDAPVWGTTVDAAMMTGIVGSWYWEKWMLRLQVEMGKEQERLLEGVVQALEEGAGAGSGWRYLTGFARK
ncbi:uncharacterized protein N0V89_011751 [Didymosphaeria variabile]|uniref:Methyltransferase type 11 domain-containing protein n=1 Tax=Didymosphaeria variabile TaxID=1932322 RepID=A0A9W9C5M1_9PLEO|nr:uncharacterized protein N0V89_011751 [Didymosphaeria variabile]KAJ4345617.1 hypothetical protein N0V89_011751 [Didymosphaeria variabile]